MSMKLAAGLDINNPATFGELRFWGLRRERQVYDDDNNQTGEIDRRTYNLISTIQQDIVSIILPGHVSVREFPQNTVVELVNPEINSGANRNFRGADAFWWITADDIVAAKPGGTTPPSPPQRSPHGDGNKANTDGK